MEKQIKPKLTFASLFGVRRDEVPVAVIVTLLLGVLHYFFIARFIGQYLDYGEKSRYIFFANFHMAGFDPTAYDVVTQWQMGYDVLRHPFLAWMMFPLFALNKVLWMLTGMNCVQFVVGAQLYVCALYSSLFMHRLLVGSIGIGSRSATLLTCLFFSFAYIMVTVIVPDHFCLSLFLLLMAIYITTTYSTTGVMQQCLLYGITAGVTLSNGVVVFIADLIMNGKNAIQPRRIVLAYALPTLLMLLTAFFFQHHIESTVKWVGQDAPRTEIVYENMFGESVQFHRKHILGDVLWQRPVIVCYLWWGSYVVEAIYVMLFIAGIWCGRRSRLLWLLVSVLAYTMVLHLLFGFAVTEIQIMAAHWIFIIPLVMGYAVRRWKRLDIFVALLTAYLLASNFWLLHRYLTWPLAM